MTTHLKSEVDRLRAELAEANETIAAWERYAKDTPGGGDGQSNLVDDVVKVWALRKAHPVLRTNVAARLAIALHAARQPLSYEQLDERVPMTWARNGGERKDLRSYISTLVCFLRGALGADAIETINGYGYQLTPKGRAALDAIWQDND